MYAVVQGDIRWAVVRKGPGLVGGGGKPGSSPDAGVVMGSESLAQAPDGKPGSSRRTLTAMAAVVAPICAACARSAGAWRRPGARLWICSACSPPPRGVVLETVSAVRQQPRAV